MKHDINEFKVSEWSARECEAFVLGMDVVLRFLDISHSDKSYDPLTFEERDGQIIAHSYALDMEDGGRHHQVDSYDEAVYAFIGESLAHLEAKGLIDYGWVRIRWDARVRKYYNLIKSSYDTCEIEPEEENEP